MCTVLCCQEEQKRWEPSVGLACYARPESSISVLMVPLMHSVVSSLREAPSTGFSGSGVRTPGADFKVQFLNGLSIFNRQTVHKSSGSSIGIDINVCDNTVGQQGCQGDASL